MPENEYEFSTKVAFRPPRWAHVRDRRTSVRVVPRCRAPVLSLLQSLGDEAFCCRFRPFVHRARRREPASVLACLPSGLTVSGSGPFECLTA